MFAGTQHSISNKIYHLRNPTYSRDHSILVEDIVQCGNTCMFAGTQHSISN